MVVTIFFFCFFGFFRRFFAVGLTDAWWTSVWPFRQSEDEQDALKSLSSTLSATAANQAAAKAVAQANRHLQAAQSRQPVEDSEEENDDDIDVDDFDINEIAALVGHDLHQDDSDGENGVASDDGEHHDASGRRSQPPSAAKSPHSPAAGRTQNVRKSDLSKAIASQASAKRGSGRRPKPPAQPELEEVPRRQNSSSDYESAMDEETELQRRLTGLTGGKSGSESDNSLDVGRPDEMADMERRLAALSGDQDTPSEQAGSGVDLSMLSDGDLSNPASPRGSSDSQSPTAKRLLVAQEASAAMASVSPRTQQRQNALDELLDRIQDRMRQYVSYVPFLCCPQPMFQTLR